MVRTIWGDAVRRGLLALGMMTIGHGDVNGKNDASHVDHQAVVFFNKTQSRWQWGSCGEGIGHVLRRHELVGNEDGDRPDDEELGLHGKGRQAYLLCRQRAAIFRVRP